MKKSTATVQASNARQTSGGDRGLFVGESKGKDAYIVDKGGQYLMRAGWEPQTRPIGTPFPPHGGTSLLEGVGNDLVRRGVTGKYYPVNPDELWGRSVALLFSCGEHPKCTSFVPFLIQFYKSVNEAGSQPCTEVIYVSLDRDEQSFERCRKAMPWLSLEYNSPMRGRLIKRYRFKVEPPAPILRPTVTLGLPRLLVVGPRGEEVHWLPCDHESPVVLREWDYIAFQWLPVQRPFTQQDDLAELSSGKGEAGGADSQVEKRGAHFYEWPLKPEDAAAWPLESQRQEAELKRQQQLAS